MEIFPPGFMNYTCCALFSEFWPYNYCCVLSCCLIFYVGFLFVVMLCNFSVLLRPVTMDKRLHLSMKVQHEEQRSVILCGSGWPERLC